MSYFDTAFDRINIEAARGDLQEQGWTLLPESMPRAERDQIKAQIDDLSTADGVEINYGGSEHRVWKAHKKSKAINEFRVFSDKVVSAVEGADRTAFNVLAIRNRTIDAAQPNLAKGRWHLDSFRRQLKIFVFLTDVTVESGAFEMIPGTHATSFKMKQLMRGNLITPKDLLEGTRSYSKLKEDVIGKILSHGYESKIFNVPAGTTALVDTSCVHRARPCSAGERYALTTYYA